MKTSELTGAALDWAVAKCEGEQIYLPHLDRICPDVGEPEFYDPSTDWSQGGPIIMREAIQIIPDEYKGTWAAYMTNGGEPYEGTGPTPLIAAMRCYVASKLGDEIDIPEELQ
jgi:hypothetical protein